MADSLELILTLVGADETQGKLLAAARVTNRLATNAQKAQAALDGVKGSATPLLNTMDRIGKSANYATGPFSRLVKLQQQLSQARSSQNVSAQMDLEYLIGKQQSKVNRILNPPKPPNRLLQAIATTRFGYGGGLGGLGGFHPLIGRSLAALGAGGPEGVAIAGMVVAAGLAAKGLYDLAATAAEAANSFERIRLSLGSGAGTTARLTGLASAIGLSPGEIGGLSASINSRISSDGLARAAASTMGIYQLPRPFGSVDEGRVLLQVAEGLRGIKNEAQAIVAARLLGAEALLPLRNLSEETFRLLKQDADLRSRIYNPQMTRSSAEFQAATSRIGQAVENLLAVVGRPVMDKIANFLNNMADGLNAIADFLEKHKGLTDAMGNGFLGGMASALGMPQFTFDRQGGLDSQQRALDDNSQALDRNTDATQQAAQTFAQWQQGYYGRGERMGRAIPEGLRGGEALRQMLAGGGMLLPQF